MYKILVVDDDRLIGDMLKFMLVNMGYDVMISQKPEHTIENIINNDIKLVVLDKLMLGIDGTTICTEIKNTQATSSIPVLMMSALSEARESCLKAGSTDFIAKPFERQVLLGKVKNILENRLN